MAGLRSRSQHPWRPEASTQARLAAEWNTGPSAGPCPKQKRNDLGLPTDACATANAYVWYGIAEDESGDFIVSLSLALLLQRLPDLDARKAKVPPYHSFLVCYRGARGLRCGRSDRKPGDSHLRDQTWLVSVIPLWVCTCPSLGVDEKISVSRLSFVQRGYILSHSST